MGTLTGLIMSYRPQTVIESTFANLKWPENLTLPWQSEPVKEEDHEQRLFDELRAKYEQAVRTSLELKSLNITPRKLLLGRWLREGDLGFVYGSRGSGKTWLIDAIAARVSTGSDLFEWAVVEAATVLLIDGEMPLDDSRDRINGMNGNERLHVLHHEVLFDQFGLAMNLADPREQQVITALCVQRNAKLLILDNLSCLFTGMKENDADEWEKVLNWLLDLRRRRIAVLIVHHSGRSGEHMRGTSKREDAAFWVIKVEAKELSEDERGAKFETSFEKERNSDEREWRREWTFKTEPNGEVSIGCTEISFEGKVLQLIQDGLTSASDIAEELKVVKSTVSKAVARLVGKNLIEKSGREYRPRGFMKKRPKGGNEA